MIPISRRRFMQLSAATGGLMILPGCSSLVKVSRSTGATGDSVSPLATITDFNLDKFNGDNFSRAHAALWDLEKYLASKGGRPKDFSQTKVVVVGGGLTGLTSAYFLRDLSPILLEQAPRFGGNAKGEIYQGTAFAMGSAYVTASGPGSETHKFYKELGIDKKFRRENADAMMVMLSNRIY